MADQIQLYHDLTAFYLDGEAKLRSEIDRLNQQVAQLKQKLESKESELRAEGRRQYSFGYDKGRREGDKEGYERGYQEAVDKAEWVYDLQIGDEGEALRALNLANDLYHKVFTICIRFYQRGWTEARKQYVVMYHCCECRKIIEVTGKNAKKAAGQYMEDHSWGHKECLEGKGK